MVLRISSRIVQTPLSAVDLMQTSLSAVFLMQTLASVVNFSADIA